MLMPGWCGSGWAWSFSPTTCSPISPCWRTARWRLEGFTAYPVARRRQRRASCSRAADWPSKEEAHPDRLSGGQQQRAALVRALCTDPKLLLLDEITAALDPELVGDVLRLVRELADEGTTMVLATHEMAFAREVATKVCFLDQGRILEQGPPAEIFTAPREARTREFLQRVLPN